MGSGTRPSEHERWRVEEIDRDPDADVSIEIVLGLYVQHDRIGKYRFQYIRTKDGVGPFYTPGRWGSSFDDKEAERDNRAAFEAAQAVAEETGTRAELFVHSQKYLNTVSRSSLSELIGEVGEGRARELLVEDIEEK